MIKSVRNSGQLAQRSERQTHNLGVGGSSPSLSIKENIMTEAQANKIKIKVEVFNELYAPITLRFQMFSTSENNWAVTITYNYTENEWMTFASLDSSYNQINDKLSGFQFGLEAVEAYQEEHGNLKFSHSDLPLG